MNYRQLKKPMRFSFIFPLLVACGSDLATEVAPPSIDVTVVDGYIKNATVTDDIGQIATYSINGSYTFATPPIYPIKSNGGKLEDTDLDFDIEMITSNDKILVISPITTFLGDDSTLLSKFSELDLGLSTLEDFSLDYMSSNDVQLAKLAQLLYVIEKDDTLSVDFKETIKKTNSLTSLNYLFELAISEIENSGLANDKILQMKDLINAIKNYVGNSLDIEHGLNAYKYNLVTDGVIEVTHNNISYGLVLSPYTGKYWLDRNIGATQACNSQTDSKCYGDYFQWGRPADGHEDPDSPPITTQADNINDIGHTNFIKQTDDWAKVDTDRYYLQRAQNWSSIDGSSVCPGGYRVPTTAELLAEITELTSDATITDLYEHFLRIPTAGYRSAKTGNMLFVETHLRIWTTTIGSSDGDENTNPLGVDSLDANESSINLSHEVRTPYANSIRCIKNYD